LRTRTLGELCSSGRRISIVDRLSTAPPGPEPSQPTLGISHDDGCGRDLNHRRASHVVAPSDDPAIDDRKLSIGRKQNASEDRVEPRRVVDDLWPRRVNR
jgi:hypothetical protein